MSGGINFIKSIGQLITGGIGIVDGALVYKDEQGEVKQAGLADVPVLTELPQPDASNAGQRFSFNGKDWEYLSEEKIQANNWDLPVGEPLPVVGFKELSGILLFQGTFVTFIGRSDVSNVEITNIGTGDFTHNIATAGNGVILSTGLRAVVNDNSLAYVQIGQGFIQTYDSNVNLINPTEIVLVLDSLRIYPPTL